MLGNGRCEVYCFDGKNRLAHIRGKMRKKVWVSAVSQIYAYIYTSVCRWTQREGWVREEEGTGGVRVRRRRVARGRMWES